jgi:hypothetical protein
MAKKSKTAKATSRKPSKAAITAAKQLKANYQLGRKLNRGTAPSLEELMTGQAKYLGGVTYSNRRKMQQLATMIDPKDWDAIVRQQMADDNQPLSWSHWIALASAPDKEMLKQAATQAVEESWSSRQLRRHLQSVAGTGNRRPGTGRAIRAPGSVADGLQQLLVDLEVVRKRAAALRKLLGNQSVPAGLADHLVVLERATEAIRTFGAIGL